MAKEKQAHSVARLRKVIGMTQTELATFLGYKRITIVSVETGRLNLSEKLASRISLKTGIDPNWLLENNPKQPPVCGDGGGPFTKGYHQGYVANLKGELEALDPRTVNLYLADHLSGIIGLYLKGAEKGNFIEIAFRLDQVLRKLNKDFELSDKERKKIESFASELKNYRKHVPPADLQKASDYMERELKRILKPAMKQSPKKSPAKQKTKQ